MVLLLLVHETNGWSINRRNCLQIIPALSVMEIPTSSLAIESSSSSSTAATNTIPTTSMPNEVITDKVFMDVRLARQDGSTYVRDDLPDTFENRVIKTRLVFGLYGKCAPNNVQKFLSYVISAKDEDVDNPLPSYGRSRFPTLDQSTGLFGGGVIPSLRVKDIGGSTALTYGNRVLSAPLWIDQSSSKLSHSTKGLLTHKTLDITPAFGITTRECTALDATHTVFGQVLWDEESLEFFKILEDIPTYAVDRPTGYDEFGTGGVASSVFNAQRDFFRGAAKSFGDTRVDKLYEGKLLRRIEVLQVGRL